MTVQVAAGIGQMMFLVDSESETVKKLEEFHPEVETEPSKGEEDVGAEASGKGIGPSSACIYSTLRKLEQLASK